MTTPPTNTDVPDQATARPVSTDQDPTASGPGRSRRRLYWALPSAALVAALVVAGGVALHGQRAHATALQGCQQAATQAQDAVGGLDDLVTDALALQDEAKGSSEVSDAQRQALSDALASAQQAVDTSLAGCGQDASRQDLYQAASSNQELATTAASARTDLEQAVGEVNTALLDGAVKGLDEALNAAQAKNDELTALVSSSEGQVADENTRTTATQASQALSEATRTSQEADRKDRQAVTAATKALTDATTAAESARAALADSHTAWQDAQNTAQAAGADASAGSSGGGSTWSGTTSTGGGSSWSGSTGGYTGSSSGGSSSGGSAGSGSSTPSGGGSSSGSSGGGLSDWTVLPGDGYIKFCGDTSGEPWKVCDVQ